MYGISPKIPLLTDAIDGHYGLNKTIHEAVQQNLKNLIFTAKGEKIMDSNFGVGLRNYLFENITPEIRENLKGEIVVQVRRYMSFIDILNLQVFDSPTGAAQLNVSITYKISDLGTTDNLLLSISN
jgi:phage baseplate assembly protein W